RGMRRALVLAGALAAAASAAMAQEPPHIMGGVCDVAGLWRADFEGLGRSRWRVAADGTARQLGPGGAVGRGRQDGPIFIIRWRSPNKDRWMLQARVDPPCQAAEAH